MVPLLAGLILLYLISACLSASEAALLAVNRIQLRHLANSNVRRAQVAYHLITHPDHFITTILIANNFVTVAITVIGTMLCVQWFGPGQGPIVSVIGVTVTLLLVGEITPKLIAIQHSQRVALMMALPISALVRCLMPFVRAFSWLGGVVGRLLGAPPSKHSPLVTEEEIRLMIELGREEGFLSDKERKMLHRVFEFGDTLVKDVMVPREQMVSLPSTASSDEILDLLVEEGHSRVPVYEGDLDHIRGILYIQGLLHLWRHQELIVLADLLHAAFTVPETKRVTELLQDFQRLHVQIAIVVDGQARTVGLVTLEDLLEEIVGEIGGV